MADQAGGAGSAYNATVLAGSGDSDEFEQRAAAYEAELPGLIVAGLEASIAKTEANLAQLKAQLASAKAAAKEGKN